MLLMIAPYGCQVCYLNKLTSKGCKVDSPLFTKPYIEKEKMISIGR